jgi:protease-4
VSAPCAGRAPYTGRMRQPLLRAASSCLVLLAFIAVSGCLPSRFVIDLAGSDGRLAEKDVMGDAGATAKVALIDVEGLISHSASGGLFAGASNSVDELVSRLELAEKDEKVRAVVLRVNSPGGTVAASDTMYNEIASFRARTKKPVVVSMAEVAASGGYYISLAADRIIAQPSTITGSIGVLVQTVNFSKGMAMIGIEARAVTSGANKDLTNPLEPMREGHYAIIQGTVDEFYRGFRQHVAVGRPGIDASRMDGLTDGRVFTGEQALREGLVDANGGLREAFAEAKRLAGTTGARMVKYHTPGRVPTSPYATASLPASTPSATTQGTQFNLVQMNLSQPLVPTAGFYYLWLPPGP